jgi:MFS family permease
MDQFGWSQTDTTMYRTIQPLVAAICAPFAGRIMAKGNTRWILAIVAATFGLASAASAFATELWQWNLYGVIFGVTSAFFMYLAAPVLVNAWFKKSVGLAISITAATLSILAAVASPIGQALINAYDWQTARLALSLVSTVLSVVLTIAFVRKDPYTLGMLPFGATEEDEAVVEAGSAEIELEGATASQAVKSPGLYMLVVVAAIFVMCAAFFQQIPAYAAHGSLGANAGAMAVSIIMVGGVIGKLILGGLNDIIGVKYTGLIAATGGALGILLAWQAGSNVALFYTGMVIFGFGYAGLTVVAPMLARAAFGSRDYSQIYSWVSTGIFIATAISFLVYGRIYDLTGSYDLCFVVVISLYVIALILIPITIKVSQAVWKK